MKYTGSRLSYSGRKSTTVSRINTAGREQTIEMIKVGYLNTPAHHLLPDWGATAIESHKCPSEQAMTLGYTLLLDTYRDAHLACEKYQQFTHEIVLKLDYRNWELDQSVIKDWIESNQIKESTNGKTYSL